LLFLVSVSNKLNVNSATCWFLLYGQITMNGQQKIKKIEKLVTDTHR